VESLLGFKGTRQREFVTYDFCPSHQATFLIFEGVCEFSFGSSAQNCVFDGDPCLMIPRIVHGTDLPFFTIRGVKFSSFRRQLSSEFENLKSLPILSECSIRAN
jgi:hypothetical protein